MSKREHSSFIGFSKESVLINRLPFPKCSCNNLIFRYQSFVEYGEDAVFEFIDQHPELPVDMAIDKFKRMMDSYIETAPTDKGTQASWVFAIARDAAEYIQDLYYAYQMNDGDSFVSLAEAHAGR